jgi:hypothetical protein
MSDRATLADWLIAFGTILVAIVAIFQDKIRSWIWKPKLNCEINLSPPDCHSTLLRYQSPGYPEHGEDVWAQTYYFRLRISNTGNTSAKNAEVILTEILKKEGDKFKKLKDFSADNLLWSTLDKMYCDYISPGTFKFCNIGHVVDPKERGKLPGEDNGFINLADGETSFFFDVRFKSNIMYHIVGPGIYIIAVKIGSENAKTISRKYEINITGKWHYEEARMFNEGVSIKQI